MIPVLNHFLFRYSFVLHILFFFLLCLWSLEADTCRQDRSTTPTRGETREWQSGEPKLSLSSEGEREGTRTHETRLRLLGGTERGEADRGRRASDRRPTTVAAIIHPHPLPPRKPEARTVSDKSGLGGIQSGAHREVKALTDGRTGI